MRFLVDVWRWIIQLLTMPKDRDENDERQHGELAKAICGLTCELFEHRKMMLSQLATKQDVRDAKHEILKAIGDFKIDPQQAAALTAQLKASADPLAEAVAANQPPAISG